MLGVKKGPTPTVSAQESGMLPVHGQRPKKELTLSPGVPAQTEEHGAGTQGVAVMPQASQQGHTVIWGASSGCRLQLHPWERSCVASEEFLSHSVPKHPYA